MNELQLSKIKIDETRNEQIIVFREKSGGKRYLPVVIGIAEVQAIKLKLGGIEPPRPLTHDLLALMIKQLGATIEKIVIDRLEENTFFAKIYLRNEKGESVVVDARPSDSVALAVRVGSPIFAEEAVMAKAGIEEI